MVARLTILEPLTAALRRHLLSLRGHLLLGVAAVWALLCVILLAFGWQSGTLLVEETNRVHLRYEAELVSNAITQQIEQRLEALERLAEQFPRASSGALAESGHEELLTLLEGPVLVDAENTIIDNWPTLAGRNGRNISHRAYARVMRHVQRPHVSEPFIGIVSGRPMVMMLVPRRDAQGRYTGFLGGLVEIERSELFEGFKRLSLGDDGHVVVATASGRLLYHPGQHEAFLRGILDASPQGMVVTNTRGQLTFVNEALKELLNLAPPIDLADWGRRIHDEDRTPMVEAWRASLLEHQGIVRQFRYHDENGETLWLDVHTNPIHVDGEFIGLVGAVRDITQRQHKDALRRWEAEHDPLTGLLNRRGFERRLEEAFAAWEKAGTPSALLLFDLDHFKPVNDEGGHALVSA